MNTSTTVQGKASRFRKALAAATLPLVTAGILAAPNTGAEAVTFVPDPDRNSQALTAWGWHTNVAPATMTAWINQGYRITDLEVNSSSPTMSAAYVKNSGSYARGWWWYYGKTAAQVSSLLSSNGARLTDIEPYSTSNGTRYAVVMVKNAGVAQKAWGWHHNVPLSTITSYASNNNMRVVDVDRNPGGNFSAVYIKNTGVDAKAWWHYYNVSAATVSSKLNTNGARPINLERLPNGNFDVVMQKRAGEHWWWMLGRTSAQLAADANQFGARIFQVKSYVVNGVRKYDALFINDSNAETTRIRSLVQSKMTGKWGFYVKKVGGSDVIGLGQDNQFEPASMIKIVHATTAMRDIQNTATTPSTAVTWYANPMDPARYPADTDYSDDKNKCAYNSDGTLLTGNTYSDQLGPVIVKQTMVYSDNRATDALTRRYGFASLNNTLAMAGATKSDINHRIGCAGKSSPQPLEHNWFTLRDAGRVYEKIENKTLLDQTHRDLLYSYMGGGAIGNGGLKDMILAEATAAGLTSAEKDAFVQNVLTRSKGGSYGYCPDFGGTGACNPPTSASRTGGGVMWLPFKSNGSVVKTPFVYGSYWDATFNCSFASVDAGTCTAFNNNQAGRSTIGVEMFRQIVKQALATW